MYKANGKANEVHQIISHVAATSVSHIKFFQFEHKAAGAVIVSLFFAASYVYLIDANLPRWTHILFAACFLYINLNSADKVLCIS